jgi:hypothetical protein
MTGEDLRAILLSAEFRQELEEFSSYLASVKQEAPLRKKSRQAATSLRSTTSGFASSRKRGENEREVTPKLH